MKKSPIYKNKFSKDIEKVKKRSKDLTKLKFVVDELLAGRPLDKKYLDHPLQGEYSDCRECHIEPDWLLIYMIRNPNIIFVRTGTHSDLF